MTGAQVLFVELEKRKAEYKKWQAELAEATKAVVEEVGVGGMFQDADGVVYKMSVPMGKFVHYELYSYTRTKRPGEERSPYPLAVKDAKAAGFDLE